MYPLVDVRHRISFIICSIYRNTEIAFNDCIPHFCIMQMISGSYRYTFRDDSSLAHHTVQRQIVTIYDYLHKLGWRKNGKIRQSEFFLYSKKTETLFISVWSVVINSRKLQEAGFVRQKDFELVKDLGLKETGILVNLFGLSYFL